MMLEEHMTSFVMSAQGSVIVELMLMGETVAGMDLTFMIIECLHVSLTCYFCSLTVQYV